MISESDIWNVATDEEKDEIYDLVDQLPSSYFGNHDDWHEIVKKLYFLVVKLESRAQRSIE